MLCIIIQEDILREGFILSEILRSREDIPQEYKWRLEDIFSNDDEWEKTFALAEKTVAESQKFIGQLDQNVDIFIDCLKWAENLGLYLEDLYTYAKMRRDEDNRIAKYQGLTDRAGMLSVQAGSALSFIVPEILAIPDDRLAQFRKDPRLEIYKHYLDNIIRQKEHILSLAEEKILAEASELAAAPSTIFSMANDADLNWLYSR